MSMGAKIGLGVAGAGLLTGIVWYFYQQAQQTSVNNDLALTEEGTGSPTGGSGVSGNGSSSAWPRASNTRIIPSIPVAAMRALTRALDGAVALSGERGEADELAELLLSRSPLASRTSPA